MTIVLNETPIEIGKALEVLKLFIIGQTRPLCDGLCHAWIHEHLHLSDDVS